MKKSHFGSVLLVSILMLLFGTVSLAQTTVTYGERVTGQVSAAQPQTAYIFTGAEGDVVNAQVIGISPGLLPTLGLNGPAGQQLAFNGGDNLSAFMGTAQITVRLLSSGTYTLQVGALASAQGDFLLMLDGGPVAAAEVAAGGSGDIQLDPNNPQQVLILTGTGDDAPNMFFPFSLSGSGFTVHIFNAAGETVALVKSAFGQFSVGLIAGTTYYAVLTLDDESATITASLGTAEQGSAPAAAVDDDACTVSTSVGVNVRSGPGTAFDPPIGSLTGSAPVTGQTTTGWYQINYNGLTGYVSASVVTVTGNCASVPTVTGPPPPAPTAVPPTPVPPPTSPPPPPPPPPPASTEDASG